MQNSNPGILVPYSELFPTRQVVGLGWKVAGFWISPVVLGGEGGTTPSMIGILCIKEGPLCLWWVVKVEGTGSRELDWDIAPWWTHGGTLLSHEGVTGSQEPYGR